VCWQRIRIKIVFVFVCLICEILFQKWFNAWRVIHDVLNGVRIYEYLKIYGELVLEKKLQVLVEEYFCLNCEYQN